MGVCAVAQNAVTGCAVCAGVATVGAAAAHAIRTSVLNLALLGSLSLSLSLLLLLRFARSFALEL